MPVTEKFTLFELDSEIALPARNMWVVYADNRSFKAERTDLDAAQSDDFDHDNDSNTGATTLSDLGIDTFDKVLTESLRTLVEGSEPAGLDEALANFLLSAKVLAELGLDVVLGFKTIEEDDLPPITIRAGR